MKVNSALTNPDDVKVYGEYKSVYRLYVPLVGILLFWLFAAKFEVSIVCRFEKSTKLIWARALKKKDAEIRYTSIRNRPVESTLSDCIR